MACVEACTGFSRPRRRVERLRQGWEGTELRWELDLEGL